MPSRSTTRYHALRAAGLCPRCFKPNPGPRTRCPACTEATRASDRDRSAKLKAARRCVDCQADLSLFDGWAHVRCFECHQRNREATDRYHGSPQGVRRRRERMASLYHRRREAGLCARCEAPSPDRSICEACRPRVKAAQIAYLDRKEAARGA